MAPAVGLRHGQIHGQFTATERNQGLLRGEVGLLLCLADPLHGLADPAVNHRDHLREHHD